LIFSNFFIPLAAPGPVMRSMPVRPNGPDHAAEIDADFDQWDTVGAIEDFLKK
jgi:hypothetical protein